MNTNKTYTTGGSKITDNQLHFNKWLDGEDVGPLSIEVGPTYGCNHNCTHCGFQQYDPYDSKNYYSEDKKFINFLNDFAELGGKEIFFAGNGEPLMNKLIDKWFKHGHLLGLSMAMSTNGIPLQKTGRVESILPFSKWIRFSVNGGDAETYSLIHEIPKNQFDKLKNILHECVQFKKDNNLNLLLQLQFVCHNQNVDSIFNMCDLHEEVGTDQLIFRNVFIKEGEKLLYRHPLIKERLKQIEHRKNVSVRWDTFNEDNDKLLWEKCSGINFRSNMNHKGDLIVCNRNLHDKCVYGNISENRFKEIWLSNNRKKLFKMIENQVNIPKCYLTCNPRYDNIFIEEYKNEKM